MPKAALCAFIKGTDRNRVVSASSWRVEAEDLCSSWSVHFVRPLLLLIDSLFRKIGVTDIIPDLALCKEEQDDKTRYEYQTLFR